MINVLKCWGRSIAAKALPLNCRWALALRCCSCRKGISFLLPEQKKRNKENSPSALFCLLRHFSPLNKKNSLRSNSFLFFTLRKAPPLYGKKVRPDLSAFFATLLRSLGCDAFFFVLLVGTWCSSSLLRFILCNYFVCFRPPWRSVKKFLHFFVKNKKLFER